MSNNMGGPAFPTDNERQIGSHSYHYEGMTLWDYYAAAALQRLAGPDLHAGRVANRAGQFADAMLKQRKIRFGLEEK